MKMKNEQQSVLPISLSGIMLLDELLEGAPTPGIPTTISFTKRGIQVRRGWRGDRQRIIECLKGAITRLEAEQEAATNVIH
jgi:hypothetical protein